MLLSRLPQGFFFRQKNDIQIFISSEYLRGSRRGFFFFAKKVTFYVVVCTILATCAKKLLFCRTAASGQDNVTAQCSRKRPDSKSSQFKHTPLMPKKLFSCAPGFFWKLCSDHTWTCLPKGSSNIEVRAISHFARKSAVNKISF